MFNKPYPFKVLAKNHLEKNGFTYLVCRFSFIGKGKKEESKDGISCKVSFEEYTVEVEIYNYSFHALKFYLSRNKKSKNKYSIESNLGDAKAILATCLSIMDDLLKKDEQASFGFIGANSENEAQNNTKRYRIYKVMMKNAYNPATFAHYDLEEISAYIVFNKKQSPEIFDKIAEMLKVIHHLDI
ncbi:MAG: hypothetical protein EAZ97_13240 [Bacteroidetes bacterium]|nr:MAG: hypothetical protein EAZ97_13240 [Bacteroidota bacterium]